MIISENTFAQNFSIPYIQLYIPVLRLGLKTILILNVFFVAALLLFSLYQVNNMTKSVYLMAEYEKKISLISQEQESLETRLSQSKSIDKIEAVIQGLGFEPVGKMRYIKSSEGGVAVR